MRAPALAGGRCETSPNALANDISPDGAHYYPAFRHTSYTKMSDRDIADLKAYLDQVPAVENTVPNQLTFPFTVRSGLALWKALFFPPGLLVAEPGQSATWNRGSYLVNGPSHCVECHTPRNVLGGFAREHLEGTDDGPSRCARFDDRDSFWFRSER